MLLDWNCSEVFMEELMGNEATKKAPEKGNNPMHHDPNDPRNQDKNKQQNDREKNDRKEHEKQTR